GELAPQHKIMVRALAVIVPGNDVAISEREDTDLDVRADGDRLHIFHFVVRHCWSRFGLDVGCANDPRRAQPNALCNFRGLLYRAASHDDSTNRGVHGGSTTGHGLASRWKRAARRGAGPR